MRTSAVSATGRTWWRLPMRAPTPVAVLLVLAVVCSLALPTQQQQQQQQPAVPAKAAAAAAVAAGSTPATAAMPAAAAGGGGTTPAAAAGTSSGAPAAAGGTQAPEAAAAGTSSGAPAAAGGTQAPAGAAAGAGAGAAAAGSAPGQAPAPAATTAAPKPVKKSKVVEAAPEAELQNDIDDIDTVAGKCKDFIQGSSCKDVEPGEGAMAECIEDLVAASESGEGADADPVPDECLEEVSQFVIARNKNINANMPLAKACKADAEKLCKDEWASSDGSPSAPVISCLRARKDKLSAPCGREVFKVQKAVANDYRADPAMAAACKADVEARCARVKDGGGRKTACLREHRDELGWECQAAVFAQEAEADEDIRLNVRLFHKCLADKRRFCPDVAPGNAAARSCLLDARNEPGFSAACREELEAMVNARVQDFRIDSRLRRVCDGVIGRLCGGMDGIGGEEEDLNKCLQDSVDSIPEGACRAMVQQYQQLAAQDIRFDTPLAKACSDDRAKLCAAVPPGSARVIRCLQSNRERLSAACRATLFDEEVRFSENIDFQYPMKQACLKEIDRFCKDVPHGNARVIRCLQDNKGKKEFGKPCLKEVIAYEQTSSQDYRLNARLRKQCDADIRSLCKDACHPTDPTQVCGGTVLRCLTEKRDDIRSEGCRKEVYYFEKMEVQNFHNDVILAAQCRGDVEKLCKDVQPGEGRVHACLRSHRSSLSPACKREEALLEQQEAEHIELRPGLMQACADERAAFCKGVAPGSARVFRCLAEKLADPDFGPKCRGEVIGKLQRRQANWRLDPPLRRACRADVAELCRAEDSRGSEAGEVYRCLLANAEDLDPGCRKELGRAVHMAFFIWTPAALLTAPCDADVQALCLRARPNMDATPGAVGTCLAETLERMQAAESAAAGPPRKGAAGGGTAVPSLSEGCRVLADIAEPPNMKAAFETTLSVALLESQLSALESKTGLPMLSRDEAGHARAVTLTGWTAVAGIAAMVVLALAGGTFAWKQYGGGGDANTVVLKARPPRYSRVAAAAE